MKIFVFIMALAISASVGLVDTGVLKSDYSDAEIDAWAKKAARGRSIKIETIKINPITNRISKRG